jgi:hypothetical protein
MSVGRRMADDLELLAGLPDGILTIDLSRYGKPQRELFGKAPHCSTVGIRIKRSEVFLSIR